MDNFWSGRTYAVAAISFVVGVIVGVAMYRFSWADSSYQEGYHKATTVMKRQFEKVIKENTMFYSEELGVVFVSKGGDTFEVVVPDDLSQEKKPK
ncbi:MAG TPA: hypothetical protein VLD40_03015 [Dissulfurispiraceae bacterium]|nr:hypothetical protein [Dissulfurispiraceae bacterium]